MTIASRAPDFRGRRCRRLLAAASLVALLAGCAVGPDFKAPESPETYCFTEDGIALTLVRIAQ